MNHQSYYTSVKRILIIVLVLNIGVALAKIIYGYWTNSLSIISDGFHSLFDGTSNVIGIIGITIASRPPDKIHTYGHEKFETFASLGIAFLLFITCFEILQSAVGRFYHPEIPDITILSFLIMGITLIINLVVSWYENREGEKLKSTILVADARHTRSDVYVSIAVILGFIAIQMGFSIVDPIIAVIIAVLIAKMGIQIIKSSSSILLDTAPLDEETIRSIVNKVPEVKECHRIRSRGPPSHIFVDLHVTLESSSSLSKAHEVAHIVEDKLKSSIPEIEDVVVHVEGESDNF
ncbi:MAG: cation transporter [Methanobacteriaceae archaeon]|jgi:cation diffusion facilitator family transporter|nr:cation transporter [Methanobacteriaceae archaeon]